MSDDGQKLRVRLVGRNGRRRFETTSKERLVAACLEPGVSVSRLALEHGVNANLLRKWIKKRTETQSLPPALLRQSSMAAMDLPRACDGVRGSASKRAAPFSSPAKVSASLPNGVKLTLECVMWMH